MILAEESSSQKCLSPRLKRFWTYSEQFMMTGLLYIFFAALIDIGQWFLLAGAFTVLHRTANWLTMDNVIFIQTWDSKFIYLHYHLVVPNIKIKWKLNYNLWFHTFKIHDKIYLMSSSNSAQGSIYQRWRRHKINLILLKLKGGFVKLLNEVWPDIEVNFVLSCIFPLLFPLSIFYDDAFNSTVSVAKLTID